MKAIRVHEFGGPEVLKYEEVPTPKPEAGQVLVKVHAAGVNPYDTYMRSGTYAIKPPLPYTPGSDAAGMPIDTRVWRFRKERACVSARAAVHCPASFGRPPRTGSLLRRPTHTTASGTAQGRGRRSRQAARSDHSKHLRPDRDHSHEQGDRGERTGLLDDCANHDASPFL